MKQREGSVRDTLVAAQRFLEANASVLAAVNSSGARKALDDALAELTGHAVAQDEHFMGSTGETEKQRRLERELRARYLRPIARIAGARLGDVPEIATLRLPPPRLVGAALVDRANAIANAATPYAATFIAAGFAPDFLTGLRALAAQLQSSLGGRTDHVSKRRGSTIALGTHAGHGIRALQMLDAVIEQQVPGDAQLLAEWRAVRRIPKKVGSPRGSVGRTNGVTPTAAPAPSAPASATSSVGATTPITGPGQTAA